MFIHHAIIIKLAFDNRNPTLYESYQHSEPHIYEATKMRLGQYVSSLSILLFAGQALAQQA